MSEIGKTLKLALPVAFGELAQMSLHLIDTALVGKISYQHLATASLVMSVVNIPFILAIGMTIAVSQMVSMYHGKKENGTVSHYMFNGFILCTLFGIAISSLLVYGVDVLEYMNQDPAVVELAKPFMRVIGWSIIPMIIFLTLKQFTDGLEFTKTAMLLSILAIPINAILAYGLIFGHWGLPRLELVGAGYATLITRIFIAVVLLLVVLYHKTFRPFFLDHKKQWKVNFATWNKLLYIGIPSSLQVAMEAGAFALSGIIVGTIGVMDQAAHQIALSIASTTFMVTLGISQAGSIRISNAYGQNNWDKISKIGKSTLQIGVVYGAMCVLGFILFRNQLPYIFNDDMAVVSLTAYLLLFAAIFQISDSIQAVSAGLLRGIKDVRIPTIYIAIAYWIIGIPLGYYLSKYTGLGAAGIWIGLSTGLTISACLLTVRFLKLNKLRNAK